MSGHSHYATIKRQKESKDAARGRVFSRHSKAIAIAIKAGGNADPEMNSKLRFAIEQAKSDNMPKVNIDRILARAAEVLTLEEVIYEGYGPEGVGILVEAATDNKNRASQEIKNLLEKGGGSMAGPGSVSFNFQPKGLVIVKKGANPNEQTLALIDLGAEDIIESGEELEVYTLPTAVSQIKEEIVAKGFEVLSMKIIKVPNSLIVASSPQKAQRVVDLIDNLEEHQDVQAVYTNLDFDQSLGL